MLLLDAGMAPEEGTALLQALERSAGQRPAVVLLTPPIASPSLLHQSAFAGAGRLTKPVRRSELRQAVAAALSKNGRVDAADASGTGTLAHARNGQRCRVLVVEDNKVNQVLAVRLLEKRGHEVSVAGNGREALDRIRNGEFDLVFMDVQMPVMSGFEATAAIRERERATGGHLRIIAMTAHALTGDRERCLNAGMDGYISKPIAPDELFAAVESGEPAPVSVP